MGQTVLESPTGRGSDYVGDLPQVVGQIKKVSEGASEKNGVENRSGYEGSAVTKKGVQAGNHKSYRQEIERESEIEGERES